MEFTKKQIRMIRKEEKKKYMDKFWYYVDQGIGYNEAHQRAAWYLR